MKANFHSSSRLAARLLLPAVLTAGSFSATAADHALLMGIGVYQQPQANLPGIDKDIVLARRIAQNIGVPPANIRELSDGEVTRDRVYSALRDMAHRLRPGDRVFIYYSGHGAQEEAYGGGARCTEGMFVHDMKLVPDGELEKALGALTAKAGQVIMLNDSCFSGGAASKDAPTRSMNAVPKYFKAVADRPGYVCGDAVNMKNTVRNLVASATEKGNNFVYLAAAADDEVAMATPNGSAATVAWESCMRNPRADVNGSGALDAKELEACAQREVNRMGHRQTLTSLGNRNLPISFAAAGMPPVSEDDAVRRSAATLEDIRQAASPSLRVDLQTRREIVIDRDPLSFSVRSNRSGYLYLLHVGSDGKTFNLLFPNDLDQNNYVQAGTQVQLPRPSWRVKAGGPVGESYVMAIVSETQKDFNSLTSKQGPFKSATFGPGLQRTLRVESTGIDGPTGQGQFGASRVVSVREVRR